MKEIRKRQLVLYGILVFAFSSMGYIKYHKMNINELGLKVLTWAKKIKGDAVDLDALDKTNTTVMKHDNWSILLSKHVTQAGEVNYQGFIEDGIIFQQYLDELTQNPPGKNWTESEQLAYWINAYNAYTVKLIVDNYPLKSIKEIGDGLPMVNSPWDIKFFKIGKVDFDLNTIEHEILRKKYAEPRIHFAINCASFSCPKLRNEAFTAENLEAQLEEQTRDFINNPDKNLISSESSKLSKIFDWFQSDFTKKSTLENFIQKYNPSFNEANKLEYLPYDWNLNE